MDLVRWKERQRRMQEEQDAAWNAAGSLADDPGLRESYSGLARAPIRLIVCPLRKNINHGGLLRLADAFRLKQVDFAPEEDEAVDMSGHRGTRACQPHRWISASESISEAKGDGCRIYALTLSDRAVSLERADWQFPCAIVLGSENDGIPTEIEGQCDVAIAIPMFGLIKSLNVASAAAIVVHDAIRRYRETADFLPARSSSQRLIKGL